MTTTEVKVQTVDGAAHAVALSGDGIERGSMRAKTAGCLDVIVEETNPHMAAMAAALLWRWRVESIVVSPREARASRAPGTDAATLAFNDIAALCGCPDWDYPGQIVRDVEALVREREVARLGTAPRTTAPTAAQVQALTKAQKDAGSYDDAVCFLTCREGPARDDGVRRLAFDLVWLTTFTPTWPGAPLSVLPVGGTGGAALHASNNGWEAVWWLPLGPKGPVAWPVVAALVAAGAPSPADVATLLESAEFTQAANAATWRALRTAAPDLAGGSLSRHTGERWGLARMHERSVPIDNRELWIESRGGAWSLVCRLYDEPFVREVSATMGVVIEEDDERGNVLHLVDPQLRCDDAAESERKTYHE